ncbi:hypothetical protein EBB07_00845 [Paenibacillaceae bacterium]|nr:hypothetical protein EBB07_00845 [Paenibacillaceae bacterium]
MSNGKSKESEMVLNATQLSEMLDLTTRRVQQLAEEGLFPKVGRGKYLAIECVKNYINFLQSKTGDGDVNLDLERALHERVKRQKTEMQLAVMKGEMHRSEDVEYVMNDMIAAFRSRILSLPSKVAPRLIGKKEIPAILELLTTEVREALYELSEYSAPVFYQRSKEYVDLDEDDEEAET